MSTRNKRKPEDPDYAPDQDGEANTKQTRVTSKKPKVAAVDTPKPNATKPIKQWTQMENEQLQLGDIYSVK
jgi:hypothetical protein